jgi:hypothetical protein
LVKFWHFLNRQNGFGGEALTNFAYQKETEGEQGPAWLTS